MHGPQVLVNLWQSWLKIEFLSKSLQMGKENVFSYVGFSFTFNIFKNWAHINVEVGHPFTHKKHLTSTRMLNQHCPWCNCSKRLTMKKIWRILQCRGFQVLPDIYGALKAVAEIKVFHPCCLASPWFSFWWWIHQSYQLVSLQHRATAVMEMQASPGLPTSWQQGSDRWCARQIWICIVAQRRSSSFL